MASPQPRKVQFGYEASLDLGVTALENGLTAAAVTYLENAVSLRRTRFALVRLGNAHRDLGQLEAARDRLQQARALPDGNDLFVLVSLAAVHCDLREHDSALDIAMAAAHLKPTDPAALSVLARCMRESASSLGKHAHLDQAAIQRVLSHADELSRKAHDARPDSVNELKERRRRRASQAWQVPPQAEESTPVEQAPASILDRSPTIRRFDDGDNPEQEPEPVIMLVPDIQIISEPRWQRAWRRVVASLRP